MLSSGPGAALPLLLFLAGTLSAQVARPQDAGAGGDAKVATHYFYWYRWPDEHFGTGGVPDHRHHFPAPEKVSYLDPAWHAAQFDAMADCGIDYALPVYWGIPGDFQPSHIHFSKAGIPAMLEALRARRAAGKAPVRLGLFYDTTTLLHDVRGVPPRDGKADLRTPMGRDVFCRTIVEFFEQIPEPFWARMDGRPLVVLYGSSFASAWSRSLGAAARAAFGRRFAGEGMFLVAEGSWKDIGQDATTHWGAALLGPRIEPGVVAVGPGYDDTPVAGRTTPIRDRDDGRFYSWSWRQAIAARPRLVLIETWNELHEGTGICETAEFGRRYLELTREYTARLRRGDPGPEIERTVLRLRHRPEPGWGDIGRGAVSVFADFTTAPPQRSGLREFDQTDGPVRVTRGRLHPHRASPLGTYVYFKIADPFCFDTDVDLEVTVDLDAVTTQRAILMHYDSALGPDPEGTPYRQVSGRLTSPAPGVHRLVFALPRARSANRQNGNTDFRLSIREARTMIRRVEVRRVAETSRRR